MNKMAALRNEKGLSMKDVAKALNLPYTTYVNYEKGEREPSSEVLIKIADYYGTSVDYLIGRLDSSPETKKAPPMTDEAKELLELYNELNPEGQRQVTDYADTLVKSGKYPRAAQGKKVV